LKQEKVCQTVNNKGIDRIIFTILAGERRIQQLKYWSTS